MNIHGGHSVGLGMATTVLPPPVPGSNFRWSKFARMAGLPPLNILPAFVTMALT